MGDCNQELVERFACADLSLSKGQGNFESLCECDAPILFLFMVQCPLVAERVALPVGTRGLLPSERGSGAAAG